jgi:hypothetical protein
VSVTGDADLKKQAGGVAVTTSGEGSARFTCRQMCASGTTPNYEELDSPTEGKSFKFKCDAANGVPATEYVETETDGRRTGVVKAVEGR